MQTKNQVLFTSIMIMFLSMLLIAGCEKKVDDHTNNPVTGTVTDIDGNVYNTVTIGTQVWMASNLRTSRFNDGTSIAHVTDATDWYNHLTSAQCDYENLPANAAMYGKLYNWYAVNTGILAPVGWHVPSDAEWLTLENYLGNDDIMGGKLKETGTAHWQSPNTAATNETGFTGLPGGGRTSTGSFYELGYKGYFWTTTTGTDTSYAYYHWLDFNLGSVYKSEDYKVDGISVRCVKD